MTGAHPLTNADTLKITLTALFWLSEAIVTLIVLLPIYRFYAFGWAIRKQDFTNRLAKKPIGTYLDRFWSETIVLKKWTAKSAEEKFSAIYNMIAGRRLYILPALLLAVALLIFGGLAIMTGLRYGYEIYISTYQGFKKDEAGIFQEMIGHVDLGNLNAAFWPFPSIALTVPTITAVAGAFLYTCMVVIRGYKARTLLSTDLLWSAFRLVIAIPLGMAVSPSWASAVGALVGFGLGAFPMSELIKLLRRLTAHALNDAEKDSPDDLLKLTGVTPDISAKLNEEEVYSPQELVDIDPVFLAVRTGLPFDFVVNLSAQSLVWSYLGGTTASLTPLGYGDARMVHRLMARPAAERDTVITALAAATKIDDQGTKMDPAVLTSVFTAISEDKYTDFLCGLG
jgi:hypothetical protein